MTQRPPEWFDNAWWEDRIRLAASTADPTLCNLRVTLAHHDLSLALKDVLGPDSGANFHAWAVWGSKKAGITIRQEDVRHLRRNAAIVGGGLSLLASAGLSSPVMIVPAAAVGACGLAVLAGRLQGAATQKILGGNITVLEDIGRVTARFVAMFHDVPGADGARLDTFLGSLRPGPAHLGGQNLLTEAFRHYDRSRCEPDNETKSEHMLLGNLYAILHEHIRLEPYIDGAMPWPFRRMLTAHLLDFHLGRKGLRVDQDIPSWGGQGYPVSFRRLENPDLVRFLTGPDGWDRTPDSVAGSRARDWSEIGDRMNYICDLFRTHHFDPELFAAPYTDEQRAAIMAGRIPPHPL